MLLSLCLPIHCVLCAGVERLLTFGCFDLLQAQGMTLQKAAMSLGDCFAYGQMYSALGRVRRISDLKLVGSLKVNCKLAAKEAVAFERSAPWVNIDNSPDAVRALVT